MLGKTHMPAGVLCGLLVLSQTGPVSLLDLGIGGVAALSASTLPDCDIYNNRPMTAVVDVIKMTAFSFFYMYIKKGQFRPWVIPLFALLLWWGISAGHRGRTHSFVATALYTGCFYLLIPNTRYTLCFAVAYLSHLMLDLLNKKGEELFWPFIPDRFALRIVKADGTLGDIIGWLSSVASIFLVVLLLFRNYFPNIN